MSDTVWWVGAIGMPDKRVTFFVTEPNISLDDTVANYVKPQARGELFDDAGFPTKLENQHKLKKGQETWADGRRLPHFFAHDFFCISNEAIAVFQDHDLGEAQFKPVSFFEKGGKDRVDEPVYMLVPGNARTCFDIQSSPKVLAKTQGIPALMAGPPATRNYEDGDVAVGKNALEAGPDIWIDPTFKRTFFMSDRLAKALESAGVAADFELRQAKIV